MKRLVAQSSSARRVILTPGKTFLSGYKQGLSSDFRGDFVTNSFGESWDSFLWKIMSPCPEPVSPKNKESKGSEIENAWAFM